VQKNQTVFEELDTVQVTARKGPTKQGVSLLDRYFFQDRHIKPTTYRKYIRSRKEYRNRIKRIDDLTDYIQFMKTHRKKK
jgi:hypothetical protein